MVYGTRGTGAAVGACRYMRDGQVVFYGGRDEWGELLLLLQISAS